MENCQMNRPGCRPYNRTCGMLNPSPASQMPMRRENSESTMSFRNPGGSVPVNSPCASLTPASQSRPCSRPAAPETGNMYEHLKHLTPAMAYVPYQQFTSAYDLDYALSVGTIFPQLCKPFCGKRGVRR